MAFVSSPVRFSEMAYQDNDGSFILDCADFLAARSDDTIASVGAPVVKRLGTTAALTPSDLSVTSVMKSTDGTQVQFACQAGTITAQYEIGFPLVLTAGGGPITRWCVVPVTPDGSPFARG